MRLSQSGDVDLGHPQHGVHDSLRFGRVLVADQLDKRGRHDLPGHSELVLQPATLLGLPAGGQLFPVVVDLGLVSQLTILEIASVNLNIGPPLRAVTQP